MALPDGATQLIETAYAEDFGSAGDITTATIINVDQQTTASIMARRSGCIAGLEVFEACLFHVDDSLDLLHHRQDGEYVAAGTELLTISGNTRSLLSAERVGLNFVGHMSGIATATHRFVAEIAGTGAAISDTRKTTPGLRSLEKYSVRMGGGTNHRMGLFDQVMIKDNHIAAAGSITNAVAATRSSMPENILIEVEVDTLDQLREVVTTAADIVLLDNMTTSELRTAVAIVDGRMQTEASGGVTLTTVKSIAETGVDVISVGWLTHSAPNLDVGMDFHAVLGAE